MILYCSHVLIHSTESISLRRLYMRSHVTKSAFTFAAGDMAYKEMAGSPCAGLCIDAVYTYILHVVKAAGTIDVSTISLPCPTHISQGNTGQYMYKVNI